MVNLGELDNTYNLVNDSEFIESWKLARQAEQVFHMNLTLRIEYIISEIHKLYGGNKSDYAFIITEQIDDTHCYECGGPEVDVFSYIMWKISDSNQKYIDYDLLCHNSLKAEAMDGIKFINLSQRFPKKWLFSDFENELKNFKQAYIDFNLKKDAEKLKKKQDKLISKDEKVRLKEQLKAKLTEEELALISFKK